MSEPSEAAIGAARRKVGNEARAAVDGMRAFLEKGNTLLSAPQELRQQCGRQVAALRDELVHNTLRGTPISALRDGAGKGARLGALEDAGFRSVANVASASPARLQAVPGIGPQTAQQVSTAAATVRQRVAADTPVRLDPDRRSRAETTLLGLLTATRRADEMTQSGNLRALNSRVDALLPEAERATSRWKMAFSGKTKKQAALAALAQLDEIQADPSFVELQHSVTRGLQDANPQSYSSEQLWQDYATEAAGINALLSTVGGSGEVEDSEAAQGFIGPELRQQIAAVPLNTDQLTATLRGYQAFGAQYAIHQKFSIIGDEMGLGKTIEALATLTHLAVAGQHRFLVVCPASVQVNWIAEVGKHSRLRTHSLHGADRDTATRQWAESGGVAVTTFDTLGRLDIDTEIAMLIVDEAHLVKNPDTKRAGHIKAVLGRAQRALFLTGTPMENRVEEFRTLVGYLQPGLAARVDATDAVAGARRFRRAVAPVYLRRNQEDVLTELPEKIEVEDWVQFGHADQDAYEQQVRARNLMGMRQAAFTSPDSAKLARIVELAEEAAEDHRKVLAFSYFRGVLDAVVRAISAAGVRTFGPLTGDVAPGQRQAMVDDFAACQGAAVFIAQVEAGGVGLNAQAASTVILAEPQWKPATENQAISRAHRMGQIHTVQVHRILAKGSIDERVREIQEGKSLLFDAYARKSEAKDADARAVDTAPHRPEVLDDEAVPQQQRVMLAERHRLGIG